MPEERITIRSLFSQTESRTALIYVEGCVPWDQFTVSQNTLATHDGFDLQTEAAGQAENKRIHVEGCVPWDQFALSPNTLATHDDFDLHNEAVGQTEEIEGFNQLENVHDCAALNNSSGDISERSDTPGRFRTLRQRSDATESQFVLGRFSASVQHPDTTEFRAAPTSGDEPCQRQIQARSITSNCFIESNASIASPSSGSQSPVSTERSSGPTTDTDPLSCTTCHKSFARPCELTYVYH
jgi:hypothetical protein